MEEDSETLTFELTEDGSMRVKAGTLDRLVERLTPDKSLDLRFQSAFLLTFRCFTTPALLLAKLLAFVEVHSESEPDGKRLERWKLQNADILGYARQLTLSFDGADLDDADEDLVPPELLEKVVKLNVDEYKVDEILDETYLDLDQIMRFLAETRKFQATHDDKLQKLIRLLKSKDLAGRKLLIFSEFAAPVRKAMQRFQNGRTCR